MLQQARFIPNIFQRLRAAILGKGKYDYCAYCGEYGSLHTPCWNCAVEIRIEVFGGR